MGLKATHVRCEARPIKKMPTSKLITNDQRKKSGSLTKELAYAP